MTHETKADELRRIARDLGFLYTETPLNDPERPGFIRFVFQLTDEQLLKLVSTVPKDVFAYQAYMT